MQDPAVMVQKILARTLAREVVEDVLKEVGIVRGEKGEKGDKGDVGDTGAQGKRGETGSKGVQGEKGERGSEGKQGPKGDSGSQGPKGEVGEKGTDGHIKDVSATEIRDLLEVLPVGDKLSIQAIENLAEELAELRKWRGEVGTFMNLGGGGGFTSPIYNFIDDETPSGLVNDINTVFTLARLPYRGSVKVFVNGQRMRVTSDYTLSSDQKVIAFLTAPPTGSTVLVDYRTL